jgi:chloramphenicol-sensitive protein RarD
MSRGVAYALLAYVAWGLFPLYFRHLAGVGAFEIVLHRVAWSLVFLLGLLAGLRRWQWLAPLARQPKVLAAAGLSALLLAANWTLYVWAVMNGRVIDASLGYFINPLVNVLLGFVVLHERLRPAQWCAVALAAAGVAWLALRGPQLPWIGVAIAFTFGLYGLLRKTAALGAIEGLTLETMILAPLAVALLGWWTWQGSGGLAGHDATTLAWLVGVGPLTAVPLLLFGAGARRIPMATLGLLQYVSPTLQLALGVWLFGEPLTGARLTGFALIWVALAVYSLEGWLNARSPPARSRGG